MTAIRSGKQPAPVGHPLANQRHELFAQGLAAGKTADAAYADAGFRRDRHHAARLATNGHVRARVAELQGAVAIEAEITLASLLAEAEAARAGAMAANQFSAAVAAIKEKGVLAGLRVEKREKLNRGVNELADDELEAIAVGRPQ